MIYTVKAIYLRHEKDGDEQRVITKTIERRLEENVSGQHILEAFTDDIRWGNLVHFDLRLEE